MVKFQSDFLQKIRENTNITDIVGSYVSLKKKGKRYWGCCPFHNEKTPSFSVKSAKHSGSLGPTHGLDIRKESN